MSTSEDGIFLSNGFSFHVSVLLDPSIIDAETQYREDEKQWTLVPVGNVCPVVAGTSTESYAPAFILDDAGEDDVVSIDANGNRKLRLYVLYEDLDGRLHILQNGFLVSKKSVYILTLTGDILPCASQEDHWKDEAGVSHLPTLCQSCKRCQPLTQPLVSCPSCFYVANLATLQSALSGVVNVRVAEELLQLANELYVEPATQGFEKAEGIRTQLQEKAKAYSRIESEAKRMVRMTKEYGLNVQEAHSNYLEDDDLEEFVSQVEDTQRLSKKLEEVTNLHFELRTEVEVLRGSAEQGRAEMNQRAKDLDKEETTKRIAAAAVGGTGTVGAVGTGVVAAGIRNAAKLENVVTLMGRGGAIGLAVTGAAVLIGVIGVAGYKFIKSFQKEAGSNFRLLARHFEHLVQGIETVQRHLHLIEESLRNIETRWRRIVDDEGKPKVASQFRRQWTRERNESSTSTDLPQPDDVFAHHFTAPFPSSLSTSSSDEGFASMATEDVNRRQGRERRLADAILKKVEELIEECDKYESLTSASARGFTVIEGRSLEELKKMQ